MQIRPVLSLLNSLHFFLLHRIAGIKDVTNLAFFGLISLTFKMPQAGGILCLIHVLETLTEGSPITSAELSALGLQS